MFRSNEVQSLVTSYCPNLSSDGYATSQAIQEGICGHWTRLNDLYMDSS